MCESSTQRNGKNPAGETPRWLLALIIYVLLWMFPPLSVHALEYEQGAHGNRTSIPKGCGSCHVGHGKRRTPMLPDKEEKLCYECHGGEASAQKSRSANRLRGNTPLANLSLEFQKLSHHPVEISDAHNPREHGNVPFVNFARHAECVDCHHHHRTERKSPPSVRGSMAKKHSPFDQKDFEYTLCYRCHGTDSISAPFSESTAPETEFRLSNLSFHPVEGRGMNRNVPSIIAPLTEESIISCTNCHNNDNPSGPNGPHGSVYSPILVKNFQQEDDSAESDFLYGLCYDCHRRSSILNDESFPKHHLHVVDQRTSCNTCHNSHGSQSNTHLIDFNRRDIFTGDPEGRVSPSSSGRLEFIDMGEFSGQCYVTCHGKDHNPLSYP